MKIQSCTFWAVSLVVWCLGCTTERVEMDIALPPYFEAKNVYRDEAGAASIPKRVLVLPCYGTATMPVLQQLSEALVQSCGKVTAFKVIMPPKEKVTNVRAYRELSLAEAKAWAKEVGADGILTCRIHACQMIRPLSLGAALSLWNIDKNAVVWSVDETMDTQMTPVASGARYYYLSEFRMSYPNRQSDQILDSPQLFFKYAFAELLKTLP